MKKVGLLKSLAIVLASGFLVGCTNQKTSPVAQNYQLSDAEVTLNQETKPTNESPIPSINPPKGKVMKNLADFTPIEATSVIIKTNKGDITVELFRDKAPLTTINFLTLAREGFYNQIVFHRVIPGFMAQVGDPLTKDKTKQTIWGTGGPGYAIADEFEASLKHDKAGVVSMANSGPNTGGSQIFITYAPQPHLDGIHAVFGHVTAGMDVLESIEMGDKILTIELID